MLELVLDGECHNGRFPERLDARHWRLEARGDDRHYCYCFHFTLRAAEDIWRAEELRPPARRASARAAASDSGGLGVEAVVDVAPDRDLLPESASSFRRHRPETVWVGRGDRWERHPVSPEAPEDHLRFQIPLAAGETLSVSRMRPCPYSLVMARVQTMARQPEARVTPLGQTVEGRSILALEIGNGAREILALAGQHPAEFGGTEAVLGIADWLLSRLPEAEAARAQYRVTLVPILNPDGNVAGGCGHNAQGQDLYRAFPRAAFGSPPEAPEARCLWDWVEARRLALCLNFHAFTQPSLGGSFPWEGLYTAPDGAFHDETSRERQRRLDDRIAWETDGLSQFGQFAAHAPAALEYQLAALGVPTVFYEVQDVVGPFRQRRTGVHVFRAALAETDTPS